MGREHSPRKKIIDTPQFPISSIYRAAIVASAQGEDSELLALVEWAAEQRDAFQRTLCEEPKLHKLVYDFVYAVYDRQGIAASTTAIMLGLQEHASPTGIRGSLSRLVERGFLSRPREGYYWPAAVTYWEDT